MASNWEGVLKRIDAHRWEVPADCKPGMLVPGIVYADDRMIGKIAEDQALEQIANVAFLPGIVYASLGMPDIHWGYGFPIGGVAATRVDGGVISPGGVGFDINCGVRFLRTDLIEEELGPRLEILVDTLYRNVPTGVGSKGKVLIKSHRELEDVMVKGAQWAVEQGFGESEDTLATEKRGGIAGAAPDAMGVKARERGYPPAGYARLREPLP